MAGILEEHHDYLTLQGRLQRFEAALAKAIRPGDRVADLGCGFGVLGLMALRAGAGHVWGIDHSDAIEIAGQTVRRLALQDQYGCIRGSTFDIDLPEPVDLIVCDHIGYFGFDYGIIAMLEDARRRMLKPGGRIMPRALRLMVAPTSSDETRAIHDEWSRPPIPPEYAWLDSFAANSRHRLTLTARDLCGPARLAGTIDLTTDAPASLAFSADLTVDRPCMVDGLAGWFEAELAEGVWMTNSPLAADRIDRPQAVFPCGPFQVEPGQPIAVSFKVLHESQVIAWTVRDPAGRRHRHSTFNSRILGQDALGDHRPGPVVLGRKAAARRIVLDLVDGARSESEIEELVVRSHPQLLPGEEAIRRFVRRQLRDART